MTTQEVVDAHVVEPIGDLLAQLRDAAVTLETTGTRTAHEAAQDDADRITRTIIGQYEDLEASVAKYIDGYLNATQYRADRDVLEAKLDKAMHENRAGQAERDGYEQTLKRLEVQLEKAQAEVQRWEDLASKSEAEDWTRAESNTVPRVITVDELAQFQAIAYADEHGQWRVGHVRNDQHDGKGRWIAGDEGMFLDLCTTIVLLEDAPGYCGRGSCCQVSGHDGECSPGPGNTPVTSEDIRNSEPGTTWDWPAGNGTLTTWEWDGQGMQLHDKFHINEGGLVGRVPLETLLINGPFTRSAAAPRGDYSKPEPTPELPAEPDDFERGARDAVEAMKAYFCNENEQVIFPELNSELLDQFADGAVHDALLDRRNRAGGGRR